MIIHKEHFEAWLFSQPDERTYFYGSNDDCLLCKFINENMAKTWEKMSVGGHYIRINSVQFFNFEGWLYKIMCTRSSRLDLSVPCGEKFGQVKLLWKEFFGAELESGAAPELATEQKDLCQIQKH